MKLPQTQEQFKVGKIYNYYGNLNVKVEEGRAYWSIEDYSGFEWQEIPDYLYEALVRFEGEN